MASHGGVAGGEDREVQLFVIAADVCFKRRDNGVKRLGSCQARERLKLARSALRSSLPTAAATMDR